MADPAIIPIPKDTWVKVATNKLSGQFHQMLTAREYVYTYRDTGGAAPTDQVDAIKMQSTLKISTSIPIDIYILCKGEDGSIRAALT